MGRPEQLREQIQRLMAEYRRRLSEGMDGADAVMCLSEIRRLESELAKIEGDSDKRE